MDSSSTSRTNLELFTCFPKLPPKLRHLIWKHGLPPLRDLKIGRNHKETLSFDYARIVPVRPPILLQVCHESRRVAFAHGSFVQEDVDTSDGQDQGQGEGRDESQSQSILVNPVDEQNISTYASVRHVWIDRELRTVYTSFTSASLARLRSLPSTIYSIACQPWAPTRLFSNVRDLIAREVSNGDGNCFSALKTVYCVLSGIIYNGQPPEWLERHDPVTYAQVDAVRHISFLQNDGSDFAVLGLDDPRVAEWTEAAVQVARARHMLHADPNMPVVYHRTSACYLRNLARHWEMDPQRLRMRTAWEEQRRGTLIEEEEGDQHRRPAACRKRFPELKPAVVFGKTKAAAFFGRTSNPCVRERAAGLLFSKLDVHPITSRGGSALFFAQLQTRFDCNAVCGNLNDEREREREHEQA